MKWCFLVNNFQELPEFFGKLSDEIIKRGDECLVVFSSKIAEYGKKRFFLKGVKFISVVDWNISNYQKNNNDFSELSWKDFFPFWERNPVLRLDYNKSIIATQQIVQFYEFLFKKEKPDIIINEVPTGLAHLLVYYLCQKNNAVYFGIGDSRLNKGAIDVYDNKFTCSKYKKTFEEIKDGAISIEEKEFAEGLIKKFTSHEQTPSSKDPKKIYFSQIGLLKHFFKRLRETYSSFFPYILSRSKYKFFDNESEIAVKLFFRAFFNAERRKVRIFWHKRFFKDRAKAEKYFLFPLHYQPEASTDVYAIYYCDQLSTARNIAFSLPFPYKLYVKEHPAAVGTRRKEFYEKLRKIPNIVLISPEENMENIIKNSSGLIVLTGTPGLEAALSGKPVYVLGDVFYSYHPLCREIKGFEELKDKIKSDLINKPDIDKLGDINNRFVISYLRNTIPGNIAAASSLNDFNDYKKIVQEIINFLPNKG